MSQFTDTHIVRVLSVKQPWAWALIYAGKDVENRTWKTNYRGRLYIHASMQDDDYGYEFMKMHKIPAPLDEPTQWPIAGAIIGHVTLTEIITDSLSIWFAGPYGWQVKDPVPIEPFYCKGALGVWNMRIQK